MNQQITPLFFAAGLSPGPLVARSALTSTSVAIHQQGTPQEKALIHNNDQVVHSAINRTLALP